MNAKTPTDPHVTKILERLRFTCQTIVNCGELEPETAAEFVSGHLAARIRGYVWAEELQHKAVVTYPTWWDHLKASNRVVRRLFGQPRTETHTLRLLATFPTLHLHGQDHMAVIREDHVVTPDA